MKKIPVEKAIGMVLYHDLTEIIPGEFKGPAFKKGYIIKAEDVPRLLNMGKIEEVLSLGVDMLLLTGGMSVDPDDTTPTGIKKAGANIISYGAPTLPGAMFLMAYIGDIPVLGLPACVMYCKTTIFDLILPRIMAGERIEKKDIRRLGHGGFCLSCENCIFPNCGYGKW